MDINDSDNFGVEMKNAKLNKVRELVVNDHTRMIKTPLNYEKPTFEPVYSTIEQCTNEYEMYQVVNVKAQLKNIQRPETVKFQGMEYLKLKCSFEKCSNRIYIQGANFQLILGHQ